MLPFAVRYCNSQNSMELQTAEYHGGDLLPVLLCIHFREMDAASPSAYSENKIENLPYRDVAHRVKQL